MVWQKEVQESLKKAIFEIILYFEFNRNENAFYQTTDQLIMHLICIVASLSLTSCNFCGGIGHQSKFRYNCSDERKYIFSADFIPNLELREEAKNALSFTRKILHNKEVLGRKLDYMNRKHK